MNVSCVGMCLSVQFPHMQGRGEIVSMQQMIDAMGSSMRLLVASVRSPEDIVALASRVTSRKPLAPYNSAHLTLTPLFQVLAAIYTASMFWQGCDTFTISPQCADQLFGEPLTWQAAQQFERDAASLGAS